MVESITAIVTSLGFPSVESFIALVLLAGAVIGAIAVIVILRPLLDFFPYAYPNARVRARIGRLLSEKQLSEIIESILRIIAKSIFDRMSLWPLIF